MFCFFFCVFLLFIIVKLVLIHDPTADLYAVDKFIPRSPGAYWSLLVNDWYMPTFTLYICFSIFLGETWIETSIIDWNRKSISGTIWSRPHVARQGQTQWPNGVEVWKVLQFTMTYRIIHNHVFIFSGQYTMIRVVFHDFPVFIRIKSW